MTKVLLLLACATTIAQNPPPVEITATDLGIVTETSIIYLEKCQRRKDFSRFIIEAIQIPVKSTNRIELVTTNQALTFEDLKPLPEGPSLLGIRSVCTNGEESPVALFTIDIQRRPPSIPKARVSQILTNRIRIKLQDVIHFNTVPPVYPPLPGGHTNAAMALEMQRMEKALNEGSRRSQ